jgi:type III pantothenate kinase
MQPNLVVDFGNTRLKMALFREKELLDFISGPSDSAADLASDLLKGQIPRGVIVSSVLKEIQFPFPVTVQFNHQVKLPFQLDYKTPETLGLDRLANVCGAAEVFPGQNVLVMDAGTCLKLDMLTKDLHYLGGSIGPGLQMRYRALHTFTDKLPLVQHVQPTPKVGQSTIESIRSGVFNGMVAEMNGLAAEYAKDYPGLNIILTGGDTDSFAEALNFPIFADRFLTLRGLNAILNQYA